MGKRWSHRHGEGARSGQGALLSIRLWGSLGISTLWDGLSCGSEGPFEQVGKGNESPVLAPPHSALVASPSRDSDSRMVLQVEAISEMDCHSSSRVSLLASDMTGHKEVGSAREAQASLPSAHLRYSALHQTHFC